VLETPPKTAFRATREIGMADPIGTQCSPFQEAKHLFRSTYLRRTAKDRVVLHSNLSHPIDSFDPHTIERALMFNQKKASKPKHRCRKTLTLFEME
jgi:hypothetical protein